MKKCLMAAVGVAGALMLASPSAIAADFTCAGPASGGTYQNVVVPDNANCNLDSATVSGNVTVGKGAVLFVTANVGDTKIAGNVDANGCSFVALVTQGPIPPPPPPIPPPPPYMQHRIIVRGNVSITNCTQTSPPTAATFQGVAPAPAVPPPGLPQETVPPPTVVIGGNVTCTDNASACVFGWSLIGGRLECSGNASCELQSNTVLDDVTINDNIFTPPPGGPPPPPPIPPIVANNVVTGDLKCYGNTPPLIDLGLPNTVTGTKSGQCSGL